MNRKERRRLDKAGRTGRNGEYLNIPEALERMIALYEAGRLHEALRMCRQLIAITPGDPDLLHMAGGIAAQLDDPAEAETFLTQAVEANPAPAEAHYNLGNALMAQGRAEEAAAAFDAALARAPDLAQAHNNRGLALAALGRFAEAAEAHGRDVSLRPGNAASHNNLGLALFHLGRIGEAEAAFRKAIETDPSFAEAHNNLGNALKEQGRSLEAVAAYGRAVETNGRYAEAYSNLGLVLHEQRNLDAAIAASFRALELNPMLIDAYKNLGHSLLDQGRDAEAAQIYERAMALAPEPGLAIRRALVLPVIAETREAMAKARAEMVARIEEIAASGARFDDPMRTVGLANFFLVYQGENDREIQQAIAGMYKALCPDMEWTAPHAEAPEPAKGRRLRVGFVSRHLSAGHTIGKLWGGIVEYLDRQRFEPILFRIGGGADPLDQGAEKTVPLPSALGPARERIAAEKPDVLIYLDIGMEPLSYYLAFARLAPVQAATWGHPVTTGIPAVDYFISAEDLEPEGAQDHYSETLARLPRLGVYYRRPEVPETLAGREKLGLPEDARLYVCAQTPFKLHPDFDAALADILARDAQGRIVITGGGNSQMVERLETRFDRTLGMDAERVTFLPPLSFDDYLALLACADVLLDSFPFGGGNTSYEAFALGAPVVTLAGDFMRGRITHALYRQMGIDALTARDAAQYAEIAVRVASDRAFRDTMARKIEKAAPEIFEDKAAVTAMEDFIAQAAGEKLS